MSDVPAELAPAIDAFRQALRQCEDLYRSAANDCVLSYPSLIDGDPDEFVRRMMDLYRGLMIKIFVEVAHANREWGGSEKLLAGELFRHVWGANPDEGELDESLARIVREPPLRWSALVGPFERIAPLRNRSSQLKTLVMRIANIIAKVDGTVVPEEVAALRSIQTELARDLDAVPSDAPGQHEAATESGKAAVREMYEESDTIKKKSRDGSSKPADRDAIVRARPPKESLDDVLKELDVLIGLASIKEEVHGLVNYLKMQHEREKHGLAQTKITLHMVFTGNPGTGKTSVARFIGRIFGAMGILSKGHMVETDRSGLVAKYAGQTGPRTNERITEALDGVLFIDEAYSLIAEEGEDAYGHEAVQALLKRMEDDRERLVVVIAGYPAPMQTLLDANPGLSSRFSRTFQFPDYTASELGRIFQSMADKNEYELPAATRVKLLIGFQHLLDHRDESFGNGRLVRNVFERAIARLANRIAEIAPLTKDLLTTLESDDVLLDGVPAELLTSLDSESRRFRLDCPGCKQPAKFPPSLLGRAVHCTRCGHKFRADWGNPVRDDSAGEVELK